MRIVRPGSAADLEGLLALFAAAGDRLRGLTSLSSEATFNEERLADAEAALTAERGEPAHFLFVLEDTSTGAILGTAGIGVPGHHRLPAFMLEASHTFVSTPLRRFDAGALTKSHRADGCGEMQSLFVAVGARGGGMGTLLSRSRLLLMAEHAERFPREFVSELRGVPAADGSFPFWEGLGRHFTGLSSREAEQIVAAEGTAAIGAMLPDGPLPIALLGAEARAVLGQVHPSTEGARRLLFAEGFELRGLANVLDAGPMPLLTVEESVSVRHSVRRTVQMGAVHSPVRALIANTRWNNYRATLSDVHVDGEAVTLSALAAVALEVDEGDCLRVLSLGGAA